MFDETVYRDAFSQVKASRETCRRVMMMNKKDKRMKAGGTLARIVLIAAVIALMALSVSASETVQNWLVSFFGDKTEGGLSEGQVEYIEENEQQIQAAQTQDGWTVELVSAMNDNSTGYIVLRITGPEGVDITPYIFGNQGIRGHFEGLPDMVSPPADARWSWGWSWIDDNDGKDNTRNLVLHLNPSTKATDAYPFGEDNVYSLYLKNIVHEYEDEAYRRELMEGKYAGEELPGFTPEETLRLYQHEIIAEGVWEFEVTFEDLSGNGDTLQILSEPVRTKASFMRDIPGGGVDDFEFINEDVLLTGIEMDHLTVSFTFANVEGMPDLMLTEGDTNIYPCVVMKDGSMVQLVPYGSDGSRNQNLLAEAPLVYEEVDYILMADGTIIPMPE